MSQTKSQLVQPVGIFTAPGVNVSGVLTASSFSGNLTGTVTGLTTTANITVGVLTATSFFGSGANLTGIPAGAYTGQNVTSVSGVTTVNLSSGNVIYFTHNTDTTVAFANTSTTQEVRFIRVKDDTATARSITWPSGFIWDGGSAPTLINNPRSTDAQIFNLTTRDGGVTWYADQEFVSNPQTFSLYTFGQNSSGQLGLNDTTQYSSPVQIPGTTWSSIESGGNSSISTKTDGTLWVWGSNSSGKLGQNNTINYSSPVQIPGTTWGSISGGAEHSLATKTDGTLWAWGQNTGGLGGGQLGQNNGISYSSPVQIPGTTWSKVNCSDFYMSSSIKTDGTLWVWGSNWNGQLGINVDYATTNAASSPIQIPGTTWNLIRNGRGNSIALKTDGTLWVWGGNANGELGQNNTVVQSSPVQVPGNTWSIITSDSGHMMSIKTDGTLWGWGTNIFGQLGQNDVLPRSSPIQIPGTTWSSISSGSNFTLATKTDGTSWVIGYNAFGQLGQNNTTHYSSPVQIPGTTWSSMSGGGSQHSIALQIT